MRTPSFNRAVLVYQAGIANVFAVNCFNLAPSGRTEHRLYQGSFDEARAFCAGLGAVGVCVRSAHCNRAGDIARELWSEDLSNAPFAPLEVAINRNPQFDIAG